MHLTLTGTLVDLETIHQALSELATARALPERPLASVRLALDELVTNVIEHGFPGVRNPFLALTLSGAEDTLEATLTDNGPPFDPTRKPTALATIDLPPQQRDIGGLGLYLVRQSVDDIRYQRQGDRNQTTIRKRLRS